MATTGFKKTVTLSDAVFTEKQIAALLKLYSTENLFDGKKIERGLIPFTENTVIDIRQNTKLSIETDGTSTIMVITSEKNEELTSLGTFLLGILSADFVFAAYYTSKA